MPAFTTNIVNRATTKVTGLDFDSFCFAMGTPLAAGPNGIYELCGDTDDGDPINAVLKTAVIDLGSETDKRLRYFYLGFEADGDLVVSVSIDGGNFRPYIIVPKKTGRQRIKKSITRKNGHGMYVQFKIENVNGSFIAIDRFSVMVNERPSGIN